MWQANAIIHRLKRIQERLQFRLGLPLEHRDHQALVDESLSQARSLSNLASCWLEPLRSTAQKP